MSFAIAITTHLEPRTPLVLGPRAAQHKLSASSECLGGEVRAHVKAPVYEELEAADG